MKEKLYDELISLGFLDAEIEELDESEKTEDEEIWVKVRFKWKWKDKDEIHIGGWEEFHTTYDYAIHEIMAFVDTRSSWSVLLGGK